MPLDEKLVLRLAGLKKQRKTLNEQMCKMRTVVDAIKPGIDIVEVQIRQNRANELLKNFSDIEREIFLINADEPTEIILFEDIYYEVITKLAKWNRSLSMDDASQDISVRNTTTNYEGRTQVKLPKINIASFDGDFMEWQSFHDLYTSTIHENNALTPSQKFQYLKGLLKGEAASLIKHFPITEANYNEAFKKLRDRYDRKKHTINAFIRTFLDQPNIGSNLAADIRRLLNKSDEVIRGLRALGSKAESRDPWLIFMLLNKVDDETKNLWSQQTTNQDFSTVEEFLEFLNNRSDALESLKSSGKSSASNNRVKTISSRTYALNTITCDLCKSSEHLLYQCGNFLEQTTEQRRAYIKHTRRCFNCLSDSHSVYQCKSKKSCHVCRKRHHTLLHVQADSQTTSIVANVPNKDEEKEAHTHCVQASIAPTQSALPTAMVRVRDGFGNRVSCRVLLDTGSQLSFISESCVQRLGIPRRNGRIAISGIGQCKVDSTRGIASIKFSDLNDITEMEVDAYILQKVTATLPPSRMNSSDLKLLANLQLPDPDKNSSRAIDILLGADSVFDILCADKIRNEQGKVIAQNSLLGWIVVGKQNQTQVNSTALSTTVVDHSQLVNLDKCLRAFWELEEIVDLKSKLTSQEAVCETHFVANTTRATNGRFIVRLPFKEQRPIFGNSLNMAIKRLTTLERKFARDEEFTRMYKEFIAEYIALGHMAEISKERVIRDNSVFLPHHGIFKAQSTTTKLRVVFDASAKTNNDISLNDALLVGPTVQSSIYEILLRYREHTYVISAEIEKMYRQILVDERDQKYQCIIWRDNPNDPIQYFQLKTITYGTSAAPFLATRVIEELSKLNKHRFAKASTALHRDMYVDDLMTGTNTLSDAIRLKDNLITILNEAGMQLRKWSSNSSKLLDTINEDQRALNSKHIKDNHDGTCLKLLGLNWNPEYDHFGFVVELHKSASITKRVILSESSKIFDPLGWLSPSTIRFKILLQSLWLVKLNWDEPLPTVAEERWNCIRDDMNEVTKIVIPRQLIENKEVSIISLHGFCDASELAYAAAAYLRVSYKDGSCTSRLIAAKTKVSPIKQISIPRLELCACALLVKLVDSIKLSTTLAIDSITAWTDSNIVLDWLSSHPRRWTTFVGNRTSQIIQSISRNNWRHVPTRSNPADCASRGMSAEQLKEHKLWWYGPDWLIENESNWPLQKIDYGTKDEERPPNIYSFSTQTCSGDFLESIIEAHSSYHRIITILSWICRFTNNCRRTRKGCGPLTREELSCSERLIIKYIQFKFFADEIESLKQEKAVERKSKLLALAPFIDDHGLLRVGGRIENSIASFETRHPIILPNNTNLVKLLIKGVHIEQGHAGLSLLNNTLKQRFWIIRAKTAIREIVRKRIICSRYQHRAQNQIMAELPDCRTQYVRPFMKVGVDYAGPIFIYHKRGKGQRPHKAYIALFICTSVKAVHIELVNDLTTEAFLAALRRFISRRGLPSDIYSDNGSNFVGANRELQEVFQVLNNASGNIAKFLAKDRINWYFNPPNAPHFGGLWEAAVKSLKFHLRRIIGKQILTYDEFNTVLTQIEAMLNSRPLSKASNEELDVLTPAHFLIGHATNYIPEIDVTTSKISYGLRWRFVQQICQHFWDRWHKEYLITLQSRAKWHKSNTEVKINDVVLLTDERTPPSKWLLGRIQKAFPGADGNIRVVEVITSNGVYKRPITKLAKLPIDN